MWTSDWIGEYDGWRGGERRGDGMVRDWKYIYHTGGWIPEMTTVPQTIHSNPMFERLIVKIDGGSPE